MRWHPTLSLGRLASLVGLVFRGAVFQLSDRETDVSWANRTVDGFSGPAMRRPAQTYPWYVRVLHSADNSLTEI